MASFLSRHRSSRPADEDPIVRQYRFLLRQAPPDAVEAAHAEALAQLSDDQRAIILAAVQQALVVGARLHPEDVTHMSHLIVLGERRAPNAFLSACEPNTLLSLARAVTRSEACFGLFGPYAAWDGADPQPLDDSAWSENGFKPDSGRWHPAHDGKAQESGFIDAYYGGRGIPHHGNRP